MFEALEKAKLREAGRLTPEDLKPPEVRTLADIKRVVAEYDPDTARDGEEVLLKTTMQGLGDSDQPQTYQVSAVTRSKSRRTILLEGFDVLRRQAEAKDIINRQASPVVVNGRDMMPPRLPDDNGAVFVDPLIRQWMGGERRGMHICWDLSDGYTYRYDLVAHKLTRVGREAEHGAAAAGELPGA